MKVAEYEHKSVLLIILFEHHKGPFTVQHAAEHNMREYWLSNGTDRSC